MEESRVNLRNQGIELINTYQHQQPLLNYISFWKYLDLAVLDKMIETFVTDTNINQSKISIIGLEIMNIFNRNTKFYFLCNFSYYNFTSGTELYFSELGCLHCNSTQDNSILAEGLAILNTSIKKLSFDIVYNNTHNFGIIKLIEGQKNLKEVKFNNKYLVTFKESIIGPLEELLIKCADTIQYLKIDWKPVTNLFSYLVNLISLEIHGYLHNNWNHLENISLPLLKYLKAYYVSSKILASIIENTIGNLIEISIIYDKSGDDEGRLIHAIYQNCPNLNYLKFSLFNKNFSEFENLLINCQILNGLEIFCIHENQINWKILYEILTRSTPIVEQIQQHQLKLEDLLQKYKTKGVIKNYCTNRYVFEDFEWIQNKALNVITNVIFSYLSEESRDNLRNQGIELTNTYQQPLLNYISFWRYLNLDILERMIRTFLTDTNIINPKIPIIRLVIMNVFNRNTKFYFLRDDFSFSSSFLGTELCFSELGCLHCTSTQDNSILAEGSPIIHKELIVRPLEEALIKCADTIQYLRIDWKPVTKLFSYLVNLISLEIHAFRHKNWNNLEKISLPLLKYLKAHYVPSKILANLIENTKGNLIEISIIYDRSYDEGRLIHAIYQNCPNLNYLKLSLFSENISEFENLLINCRILNGLVIIGTHENQINWKLLFEILTRSTPINKRSMLLQFFSSGSMLNVEQKQHLLKLKDLLQKYKTKGVIKNYNTNNFGFEDFEWIQSKFYTLYDD
ncbi:11039_t:CDS:2 [Rhizophagus irregularis]|nr:11039_t:CDS:2 [Rhizophagus irregularis]